MNQQSWSKHLVIVKLPAEPHTNAELETVIRVAVNGASADIIIDFARIETIAHRSVCNLVILNRILRKSKRHLGLCHIHPAIKETLQKHGFSSVTQKDWEKEIILEPLSDAKQGGTLMLARQGEGEPYEKRQYQRLSLSKWLKINVQLWPIDGEAGHSESAPPRYWEGVLADVSEGGARVVLDLISEPSFHKGQAIRLRFAPIAYDTPATFDALVREHLTTANEENVCLGLEFAGLEANHEGHLKLQRLCKSGLRYFETTAPDTAPPIQTESLLKKDKPL
jgi:anti-anti-sigma regulatory factor